MTIVLVHGAWHGPWCYDKVKRILEKEGHRVIVPQFPCQTTKDKEASLAAYHEILEDVISPLKEPVILCGHSLGGLIITQFASQYPELIEKLVYIAAFIPKPGQSLTDCAIEDTKTNMQPAFLKTGDDSLLVLNSKVVARYLYNTCDQQDVQDVVSKLVPQSQSVMTEKADYQPERIKDLNKISILCKKDRAVSLDAQQKMQQAISCQAIVLDSCHSPFLSMPEELVRAITL